MTRTIELETKFAGDAGDEYTIRFDGDRVWMSRKGEPSMSMLLIDFDKIAEERANFHKLNAIPRINMQCMPDLYRDGDLSF